MKCEFYQDENGKIWFFNAGEIWIRTQRHMGNLLFNSDMKQGMSTEGGSFPHKTVDTAVALKKKHV